MSVSVSFNGGTLTGWQRQIVLAAAALIRERFGNPPSDPQARAAHDGLLEVLDPKRRVLRMQREQAQSAHKSALTIKTERRGPRERRSGLDRRCQSLPPPNGIERRRRDRRNGADRRTHR
jgi:hypothetical protein